MKNNTKKNDLLTREEQTNLANSLYRLLKEEKATLENYRSFDYDEYHIERTYKIKIKDEPRYEFIVGFEYADDYMDKLEEARWEAEDLSQYPRGSYTLRYGNQLLARGKPTLGKLGTYIDGLIQKEKPHRKFYSYGLSWL